MNTNESAGYCDCFWGGWIDFLRSFGGKRSSSVTSSVFRRKPAVETSVQENGPEAELVCEKAGESQREYSWDQDALAGKSAEDISVLRKETLFAIRENQIGLSETIAEIARTIDDPFLDSVTKSAIRDDLDRRFNDLMLRLDEKGEELGRYDLVLSKMFARRASDNRPHETPVHA